MLCPKTSKEMHYQQEKVRGHLQHLRRKKRYRGGGVYQCPHCGAWHVGSRLKTFRVREKYIRKWKYEISTVTCMNDLSGLLYEEIEMNGTD